MWPWMKSSPQFVNNLDNRFKAQEKLLHEQHQMIKGKIACLFVYLKKLNNFYNIFRAAKSN